MSTQYSLVISASSYSKDADERIELALKPMSSTVMIEDLRHFLVKKVYFDQDYIFELKPALKARNIKVHTNRYLLQQTKVLHDSGIIQFNNPRHNRTQRHTPLFQSIYGTCKIQISFEDNNGYHMLETEPFEVLIPEKMDISRVENMARVIADQADLLLQPQLADFEMSRSNFGTLNSLEERMTYLFMIRDFLYERLNLLKPDRSMGMEHYVIDWVSDIYAYLADLLASLKVISFSSTENVHIEEGYQRSSTHLKVCTQMAMNRIVSDLEELQSSFACIRRDLEQTMGQEEILPEQLILRHPEFRQFFEIRSRWNAFSQEKVTNIEFMSLFMEITALYEGYNLCQLLRYFQKKGYQCTHVKKEFYRFVSDEMFQNSPVNNVYTLENDSQIITLYYQPAIVAGTQRIRGNTGLFRNTNISFPVGGKTAPRGTFYTPDFVIRFQDRETGVSRYVIADSKFMDMERVVSQQIIPLIYKYLFAISCENPKDSVDALFVFCGSGQEAAFRSLYNLERPEQSIHPRVEMVVCAQKETDSDELIEARFDQMFDEFMTHEKTNEEEI